MRDFTDLRDGGRRLGTVLVADLDASANVVLVPALPNGVPVVLGIDAVHRWPVHPLEVERGEDGVRIAAQPELAGRVAVVVDDGVETGTVARAAAAALRTSGVAELVLAVPVCPHEAVADLQRRYDRILAVVRPMARRDLTWHYDDVDTVDVATARALLAQRG